MGVYCTAADLEEHILKAYLDKLEELHPGLLEKNIRAVSAEIDDALRSRYVLPLSSIPGTLRRIAAVLVSYRSIGAITSLMDTEAGSDNQFLYIQDMHRQARKDLDQVRTGEMDLGLVQLGLTQVGTGQIKTKTSGREFDLRGY